MIFKAAAWGASQVVLQSASVATAETEQGRDDSTPTTSTTAHGASSRVFTTGVRANKFGSWKEYARAALDGITVAADGASPPTLPTSSERLTADIPLDANWHKERHGKREDEKTALSTHHNRYLLKFTTIDGCGPVRSKRRGRGGGEDDGGAAGRRTRGVRAPAGCAAAVHGAAAGAGPGLGGAAPGGPCVLLGRGDARRRLRARGASVLTCCVAQMLRARSSPP